MKKSLNIILILLLIACNTKIKSANKNTMSSNQGKFTANLGGVNYDVAIKCSYFNEDYFMFKSDQTDYKDSNGDGIIVSGFQKGSKMVLTIIDNGVAFSSANVDFTKSNNTASGSGKLFKEGDSAVSKDVSFKVTCQ